MTGGIMGWDQILEMHHAGDVQISRVIIQRIIILKYTYSLSGYAREVTIKNDNHEGTLARWGDQSLWGSFTQKCHSATIFSRRSKSEGLSFFISVR